MQRVVFSFIEGNRVRPRVQEYGSHAACSRVGLGILHQCPSRAASPHRRVHDQVVNMQVRAARQGVDGPHAQHADDFSILDSGDQLVPGMRLPPDTLQEFCFVQGAELGDDRVRIAPFGGG